MSRPRGEYADFIERLAQTRGARVLGIAAPEAPAPAVAGPEPAGPGETKGETMAKKTPQARYTKPGDDGMTGLERSFAQHLEARRVAGEIWRWELHAIKLRVVAPVGKTPEAEGIKGSYYTPDFLVFENDGTISIFETKGYHDPAGDAWIKYKDAVSRYPFAFYFVRKVAKAKGTWDITRHR